MSIKGPVIFTFYKGNLKAKEYIQLLENEFVDEAYELMGEDWIFQQDGAKPQTAKKTMND